MRQGIQSAKLNLETKVRAHPQTRIQYSHHTVIECMVANKEIQELLERDHAMLGSLSDIGADPPMLKLDPLTNGICCIELPRGSLR
jgi:hypothetical protein